MRETEHYNEKKLVFSFLPRFLQTMEVIRCIQACNENDEKFEGKNTDVDPTYRHEEHFNVLIKARLIASLDRYSSLIVSISLSASITLSRKKLHLETFFEKILTKFHKRFKRALQMFPPIFPHK